MIRQAMVADVVDGVSSLPPVCHDMVSQPRATTPGRDRSVHPGLLRGTAKETLVEA
ncbi:hypothetical protein [Brevundimonas aurifodinae]|uniref:Uncharacterized protein n=1 Tax=Brevundimonas aurifodinae TaxID=1508312 RepID=A0ABV1NKL4_9CAUL